MVLVAMAVPTGAVSATAGQPEPRPKAYFLQSLEMLRRLGVPASFLSGLSRRETVFEGSEFFSEIAGDLNGDGRDDVFAIALDYRIKFGEGAASLIFDDFSFEAKTVVAAVSGASGDILWEQKYDDFVWPSAMEFGGGTRGALLIHGLLSMLGPISQHELVFDAVDGATGKSRWVRSYEFVTLGTGFGAAGHDAPLWFDIFDGTGNGADDILLAVGTFAATYGGFVVTIRTLVIDGATGDEREHPAQDVGANWLPLAFGVDDLDGDGKDDYVVSLSTVPGAGNDRVVARSGRDGTEIWRAQGYDFSYIAWVYRLADIDRDGTSDFAITTFKSPESWSLDSLLVGGATGDLRWRRPGGWPSSPGDIDGDDHPDVIARDADVFFGKGKFVFEHSAYTGTGKRLWAHRIESRYKPHRCRNSCSAGAGIGFWEVGDLQPDGVTDSFVYEAVEQNPGEDRVFAFTLDGKTGARLLSGEEGFYALGVAVDGHGTDVAQVDVDKRSVSVSAARGSNGTTLWRSNLTYDLPSRLRDPWLLGANLDHDRCGDILVVLDARRGGHLIALSGSDGTLLWWRSVGTRQTNNPEQIQFVESDSPC